jgi:cytochrome c-type protein NapC
MLGSSVLLVLAVALIGTVVVLFGAGQLLQSRWGRRALLLGAGLLPLAASAGSFKAGVEESSRTRFCLSCHEMKNHGQSLFADNRKSLPAVHFQDRLVDRDRGCYACHTDYAMFGDFKAKLNGLRHVYVHYLGEVPDKLALYQPYPNYNCLHCHEDARGFLEHPAHGPVSAQIGSGELSCLKCHSVNHDMTAVAERRLWGAR